MKRSRVVVLLSLAAAAATGCELLIGTETRTLNTDGGGVDASEDEPVVPDAQADGFVDDASDAAVIPPDACGASCLSQAASCGNTCVTVYNGCVANCSNTPCKTGCATSETACFGNCNSTCTGCMSGAGCANQSLCADASHP